ncbi:unnamed protein product [Rhizoctonia solani]|uniref:Protein kinase domain-containing protein n=1 Tax=Rhizoctonia solani TaxID=456999 RepID=A0A8H3E9U9_9AGAM|nr:unnamed protein product [Rhizoctonia solani]
MQISVNGTRFETHKYLVKRFQGLRALLEDNPREISVQHDKLSAQDFCETFKILYTSAVSSPFAFTSQTLVSALRIATIYEYHALRYYCIQYLETLELDAIKRIELAREFQLSAWEDQACHELEMRDKPITAEEAKIIGLDAFVRIAEAREREQRLRGKTVDAANSGSQKDDLRAVPRSTYLTPPGDRPEANVTRVDNKGSEMEPRFAHVELGGTYGWRQAYGYGIEAPGCQSFKILEAQQLAHAKRISSLESTVKELDVTTANKLTPAGPRAGPTTKLAPGYQGHTWMVYSVAFSPDGKSVTSGSGDGTIQMWDAYAPSPVGEPLKGHRASVNSVSYSPFDDLIASGSGDKTIRLWDTSTGQQSGKPLRSDHAIYSVAFSPDASLIAAGSGGPVRNLATNAVQLWNVQKREAILGLFRGHTKQVNSVSFSPDDIRLVSGSDDKEIRVWDVEGGKTIVGPIQGHTRRVHSTAFSPTGTQIVSCSEDGTIRIWDTLSGAMISEPYKDHTGDVYSAIFSPCGTYIASGGRDKTVRLWDIRAGRQMDRLFGEHTGFVSSVAFSPCGQYIASGSWDRKVVIRHILGEGPDSDDDDRPQTVTSQMVCDLSSTMDTNQDAARIVSGGGFGDIWAGRTHDGTRVAIKAWRTDALEQTRYKTLKACPRAARELYYWSRMEHNNIHRLMGVIIFRDGYLGMVSEWMENGDLHKYLRHHPNADRYQLCIHVALGVEYMHGQSTVHGDLKAANILVSSDGVARLSDFDFSIMSEASDLAFTASSNTRAGSVRWVAPEMLDGEIPTRTKESDVYALGMTILEVFTGQVPYSDRRLDAAVILAVMRGTLPVRPVQHLKDNEQGNRIWKLLLECWSRNPSERPSAGRVVQVLESGAGKG